MSFAATLRDVSFHELLHLVAFNKRSGRLRLTSPNGHALFLFREGRIIYAASSSLRESFGSILLCRGLVTEADLRGALERQDRFAPDRRLGALLVDAGKLSERDVQDVVRQQALKVVGEAFRWKGAFFRFDAVELAPGGEAELDVNELLAGDGFDPEALLFEAVTSAERAHGTDEEYERTTILAALSDGPTPGLLRVPPEWEPGPDARVSLESLMAEVQSPAFTGEIALALLRYASSVVERGLFFVVHAGEARAIGQFGFDGDRRVLRRAGDLRVLLTRPSLLSAVVERREAYRGPLPGTPQNESFSELLGGGRPRAVVAIPMIVGGRVGFIFYGDDLPSHAPIGPSEGLEYLIIEAGLAMERLALERRQRMLERRRPALADPAGRGHA